MLETILDETSGVPLWVQLKDVLYSKIVSGEWSLESRIPTEDDLVTRFSVSRSTVRAAIIELTRQGILYRKRGVGTFVVGINLNTQTTHSPYYTEGGDDYHENLSITEILPDEESAHLLQIGRATPVFEFVRLRHAGPKEAKVLERSYIPCSLCPELPASPPDGKFYTWLAKKYNLQTYNWETFIEAVTVTADDGKLMAAKAGSPALLYKKLNLDAQGKPIYFSVSFFLGELFVLTGSSASKGWFVRKK